MSASIDHQRVSRALRDATDDPTRARVFVSAHHLGFPPDEQPEKLVWQKLRDQDKARIAIVGPAGSGKTSVIVDVLSKLDALPGVMLAMRVPVGSASITADELRKSILTMLADLLEELGEELTTAALDIDLAALRIAAAETKTTSQTSPKTSVSASAGIGPVSVRIGRDFGTEVRGYAAKPTPMEQINGLTDALADLRKQGVRVLLVIDDTEHFATNSEVDNAGVSALYKAIAALSETDLHLVLALHPEFLTVDQADHVITRGGFDQIPIAALPSDDQRLADIIDRRLAAEGIAEPSNQVFSVRALAQLEGLYHTRPNRHDYRHVLRIARAACQDARKNGTPTIRSRNVQAALEADGK